MPVLQTLPVRSALREDRSVDQNIIIVMSPDPAGERGKPKLAQRLADTIEQDIFERHAAGDHLGTESELIGRYQVSRSTMREALTLVSSSGLAEVRRGQSGGLVVTRPSFAFVAAGLQSYLGCLSDIAGEVLALRRELEDLMLILAIRHIKMSEVEAARLLIERHGACESHIDRMAVGAEILEFLVEAARNPLMAVILLALASTSVDTLGRERTDIGAKTELADAISVWRRAQLAAVIAGDGGRALAANAEIYMLYGQLYRLPLRDGPRKAASARQATPTVSPIGFRQCRKLADVVARRIRNRIAREALRDGDLIGSEQDLIAHYGVSRAVVREAIRLLERFSLVRMVRGKQGGLRVVAPDADAVVQASGRYLRTMGVKPAHLQKFGMVLGLAVAEHAARRHADLVRSEVEGLFAPLVALHDVTMRELAVEHFRVLANLAGAGAMGLVANIVAGLFGAIDDPELHAMIVRDVVPETVSGLIEAILSGDIDLARRAMIQIQRVGARVRSKGSQQPVSPSP